MGVMTHIASSLMIVWLLPLYHRMLYVSLFFKCCTYIVNLKYKNTGCHLFYCNLPIQYNTTPTITNMNDCHSMVIVGKKKNLIEKNGILLFIYSCYVNRDRNYRLQLHKQA